MSTKLDPYWVKLYNQGMEERASGRQRMAKKKSDTVQINVDVNMTLEISREEWQAFGHDAQECAEANLGSEEISTMSGRAWVCNIDKASKL